MGAPGIEHVSVGVEMLRSEFEASASHDLAHGNSFPASPVERQLFYRDDTHKWYQYNGTAWHEITGASTSNLDDLADVSVAAPADGDIFYYDTATGLWKSKAHTDLTTGVHGVGARHVAETSVEDLDLAAHHERHEWLGDDPIGAMWLLLQFGRYISNDWRTMDGWSTYFTNSGSMTWDSIVQIRIHTGATNNSHAAVYTGVAASISPQMANRPIMFWIQTDGAALTVSQIRLYALLSGEATPPSDTSKHIGFKIINGEIWATNADGTTETATDTGVSIQAAWATGHLIIVGDGTSIKYYVNDALVATHTTNIPANYNYRMWCGILNTAATDQIVRIHHINVFTGK